jgi:pyruvate/2-oxoglutarate dehydrogenase complex dihydrolipoamide acyltransferase (E2) component
LTSTVQGSGENGRIVKKDIENYQPSAKPVLQLRLQVLLLKLH